MEDYSISPFFSLVMPVYNGSKYLNEALDSIVNQSFENFELIVVDDGSRDNSREIILSYVNSDKRIRHVFQEVNAGASSARNIALDLLVGEYVFFWDADDIGSPKKLQLYFEVITLRRPDLLIADYSTIDENGNILDVRRVFNKIDLNLFYYLNPIPNPTACVKASVISRIRFKEHTRHEDFVFWFDLFRSKTNLLWVKVDKGELLTYYRVTSSSLSGNKLKSLYWRYLNLRKDLNFSIAKSCYLCCIGIIKLIYHRL